MLGDLSAVRFVEDCEPNSLLRHGSRGDSMADRVQFYTCCGERYPRIVRWTESSSWNFHICIGVIDIPSRHNGCKPQAYTRMWAPRQACKKR